jgi:hypothetical protein
MNIDPVAIKIEFDPRERWLRAVPTDNFPKSRFKFRFNMSVPAARTT